MNMQSPRSATWILFTLLLLCFGSRTQGQSYELSPLWSISPGAPGYDWVSTNHTQRGLAYNPTTTHLLTVSRYPATNAAVYILDSINNGAHLGNLSVDGVFAEINFPLNMIGVAGDGVIYACNLTVDSTNTVVGNNGPFRIYRWANEAAEPTVAYIGDPSEEDALLANRRFGDSLAVRGQGIDTEILVGSRSGKTVTRFTTSDGLNFTHQKIAAPDLTGVPNTMTIAFGTNNTFWTKTEASPLTNHPLQYFSFDPGTATATLIQSYTNGSPVGGPLAFDIDRNLLATIGTRSHELRLYKLTESGFVQQHIEPAFGTNANGNNTGMVLFHNDKLFALESNNGIWAYSITTNSLVPFSTSISMSNNEVTFAWPSTMGFAYQLQFKDSLTQSTWSNLGNATNGTGSTITLVQPMEGAARFYQVRAE